VPLVEASAPSVLPVQLACRSKRREIPVLTAIRREAPRSSETQQQAARRIGLGQQGSYANIIRGHDKPSARSSAALSNLSGSLHDGFFLTQRYVKRHGQRWSVKLIPEFVDRSDGKYR